MLRKIGVYYHPSLEAAHRLAEEVRRELVGRVAEVWISSAWDPHQSTKDIPGTELLICIGGDGTVLRAARTVIPHPTLILGVDMGRLAFLTEVLPADLLTRLPNLLQGNYRVEERSMLDVHLSGFVLGEASEHTHALNDVIMGRTSLGRPVYINVQVNGDLIGLLRADAVIVATATGSTGYSLSAGGPILDPLARSMVITPAAPHLAAAVPLVLPEHSEIELRAASVEGRRGQYRRPGPVPCRPGQRGQPAPQQTCRPDGPLRGEAVLCATGPPAGVAGGAAAPLGQ